MLKFLAVAVVALALSGCSLAGDTPVGGASGSLFHPAVLNAPAVAYAPSSLSVAAACQPVVTDDPTFGVARARARKTVTLEK